MVLGQGHPSSSPRKLATWLAKRNRPFSEDLLCPWCWTILPRSAQTGAVSGAEKNLPWRCPNQNSVSVIYSRPQRAASFLHLNSTLPQSRVCAGVMGGDHGQEGKTNSSIAHLRPKMLPWVSEVLCSLQQRYHFKKYYSFDFVLTQGFCDISTRVREAEGLSATRLLKPRTYIVSSGLTSRTRIHLHPLKYHGTACALCHRILPFQWDFLIVSTNSPIRKPVGCMQLFCCILVLTLPPLSHSHSSKRHTDTILLRRGKKKKPTTTLSD